MSHSGAGTIKVGVESTPEEVCGTVEDDGRGFDPWGASPHAGGGLKFMRERIALVGGILNLESASGDGTRIELTVPLSKRG